MCHVTCVLSQPTQPGPLHSRGDLPSPFLPHSQSTKLGITAGVVWNKHPTKFPGEGGIVGVTKVFLEWKHLVFRTLQSRPLCWVTSPAALLTLSLLACRLIHREITYKSCLCPTRPNLNLPGDDFIAQRSPNFSLRGRNLLNAWWFVFFFFWYTVFIPSNSVTILYVLRVTLSLQAAELYFLTKLMNYGLYTMEFYVATKSEVKLYILERKYV